MNIKKKNFHEDDNKTQMNHIKNKSGITSNIIELKLNNQIHNHKNSDFSFNKVSEKNLKKNQSYQNNLFVNKANDNNLLTKIVKGDKNYKNKKEINNQNNAFFEVKVLFDRKTNKINNNYFIDNKTTKIHQVHKDNNINNNKNKFPQDNIKKQVHKLPDSKKAFNKKGEKEDNKYLILEITKKEKEKKLKNDNLDTGKIIFNNIFKKEALETKIDKENSKPSISDNILENILLLKNLNQQNNSLKDFSKNERIKYKYCLYYMKEENNYINNIEGYSTLIDYDQVIKNNITDKIILSQKLLQLKKRNWYYELKLISDDLKERLNKHEKNNYLDIYLHNITKIYEHFNWIIHSISIFYNNFFQNNQKFSREFFEDTNLPDFNSPLWIQGFEWKGLYIITMAENESNLIRKEIKAMKFCFYDYLQLLEKEDFKNKNKLSDEIIFPLIGYSIINGIIIYVSVLINPDKTFNNDVNFINIFINEILSHNKGIINYVSDNNLINLNTNSSSSTKDEEYKNKLSKKKVYELISQIEKNYYKDNLLESKLFLNMSEFHLIPVLGGKFILINANKLIPNLFEIDFKNYKMMNFFSEINHLKFYDSFLYNLNEKIYKNNNEQTFNSSKAIIEKYNLNINQTLKMKDLIINKVYFRILYENTIIINKNQKSRRFIDHLFNYRINFSQFDNVNMKYIGEKYLLIYDLIEPLKLEYSLVKKTLGEKDRKRNRFLFYLQTNYISYFVSWCKCLNKNSYNIKTYSELKYSMKKFGINSNMIFFSLMNIENEEITDIIKISILIKLIKYLFLQENNDIIYNNKSRYLFEEERKGIIFFLIKCILYINELSISEKNKFEKIYERLLFYTNIFLYKMRLIDNYLSLGFFRDNNIKEIIINLSKNIQSLKEELFLINEDEKEFDISKIFLKSIIYIARKKPFLFLSELELKLNFIIEPFIKFKSSISIESMHKKLKLNHIYLNTYFNVFSFINSDEISGFILVKLIKDYNIRIKSSKDNYLLLDENNVQNYEEDNNLIFKFERIDNYETKSFNQIINKSNIDKKFISYDEKNSLLYKSPNKSNFRFFEKQDSSTKLDKIKENILIRLPTICYKMFFEYENSQINNNIFKDYYKIPDIQLFFAHFSKIELIFKNIYSFDGKIERTLFHSLVSMYIISFFMEKKPDDSKKIIEKMIKLFSLGNYYLSFIDMALLNLFQGLNCEAYLDSEEYYSKSVMLFLMVFGDPRGRNNDSHQIMQLPLWKIVRKTMRLEREQPENNQYFYEMYKSLEYFNSTKDIIKSKSNNNSNFDYEKNIFKDIKSILTLNEIIPKEHPEQNNNINDINNYINEEQYLSQKVFTSEMIQFYLIKNFNFPFVEEETSNVIKKIYSSEFIIFLFKQIQSILIGNYKIYDEKYIKKIFGEDILNLNQKENKKISMKETNRKGMNKSSINIKQFVKNEMEFSPSQLINAFQQGKKIFELFAFNNKTNNDSIKIKNMNNSPNQEIKSKKIFVENSSIVSNKNRQGKFGVFSHFLYDELLQKLSYKSNPPSGIVVTFGNNSHFETTYEDYKIIKYPLLIYKLKNITVKKIYSGWEHNIIISNTNEIYSFGNNKHFQCGIPFSNNYKKENITIKNPQNISCLNGGIKGNSASCGNEHTLILDVTNNVYSFGNNEDGVLGVENNDLKSYSFIKIDFGNYNGRIKKISSGTLHNVALTDDGNIFTWGSSQGGQLGFSEEYLTSKNLKNFSISIPTIVPIKKNLNSEESIIITKIACGEAHTIALDSKKEVYSWGFGSNGQLGLGFCEDSFEIGSGLSKSRIFTPRKIQSLQNKNISDIQCGKTFSMFIDSNGGLYSCGVNDLYQLGIPDTPPQNHVKNYDSRCFDYIFPTKLDYFLDMKVEKISCGEAHCLAIVKDFFSNERIIWSWGNNGLGQLGLGDKMKVSLPKPITFLFEYKKNKFENVSCGGFHSLCLIKHRDDVNWIENDFKYNICRVINEIWNY